MSSESGAYYGGHDDDEMMSYTDHDATSIEDMGNGYHTDDEPHDMMEHYTDPGSTSSHDMMERYTDPDSTSFHDMMEHSYDYNSDNLMEHYIDNDTSSMMASFDDNDLPCMSGYTDYSFDNMQEEMDDGATVHKVYYPKLARGATYNPSSPRRSNMRTTMRSCYQAPSTSRRHPKEDIGPALAQCERCNGPGPSKKGGPYYVYNMYIVL